MKRILRLTLFFLVTLTIALSITFGWLCYQEAHSLVFPHSAVATGTPADYGISDYQDITLTTVDGLNLDTWYVPPTRDDGATFMFIHGLGGNRGQFLSRAELFALHGYGMFFLEMRNHGSSDGTVTTMGVWEVRDVQAAFDFLIQQPDVNPERIAIYGHSMGASVAILAFRRNPQARVLISDAAYADFSDNLRLRIPQDTALPAFIFPQVIIGFMNRLSGANIYEASPIAAIPYLDGRPLLLIHGTADRIVPFVNGERLYAAAHEPKEFWVLQDVGHESSFSMEATEYEARIFDFLERYLTN